MRIGTWNVEYAAGAEKNSKRLEVLRANPADVWVLTESQNGKCQRLTYYPARAPLRSSSVSTCAFTSLVPSSLSWQISGPLWPFLRPSWPSSR